MKRDKESLATEIIGMVKRQRNIWIVVAIVSIVLNLIQWII